jgi:hypothetical protein
MLREMFSRRQMLITAAASSLMPRFIFAASQASAHYVALLDRQRRATMKERGA